jgi:hypothetical protein
MRLKQLSRRLNRGGHRHLTRYATRMQYGLRRPNHLRTVFQALNVAIRLHKKWIKEMPERWDPQYIARKAREEKESRERYIADLKRVYGHCSDDDSPDASPPAT